MVSNALSSLIVEADNICLPDDLGKDMSLLIRPNYKANVGVSVIIPKRLSFRPSTLNRSQNSELFQNSVLGA